jgi:hypothetical protein
MSDTPRLDALLAELCGLDETEMQLPQAVLINLHRLRLRAPLTGLARYAREMGLQIPDDVERLEARLRDTYGLGSVRPADDERVGAWYALVEDTAWSASKLDDLDPQEQPLFDAELDDWTNFDSVVWLYCLSRREVSSVYVPELIEAILVSRQGAHRMVLDMAALAVGV